MRWEARSLYMISSLVMSTEYPLLQWQHRRRTNSEGLPLVQDRVSLDAANALSPFWWFFMLMFCVTSISFSNLYCLCLIEIKLYPLTRIVWMLLFLIFSEYNVWSIYVGCDTSVPGSPIRQQGRLRLLCWPCIILQPLSAKRFKTLLSMGSSIISTSEFQLRCSIKKNNSIKMLGSAVAPRSSSPSIKYGRYFLVILTIHIEKTGQLIKIIDCGFVLDEIFCTSYKNEIKQRCF